MTSLLKKHGRRKTQLKVEGLLGYRFAGWRKCFQRESKAETAAGLAVRDEQVRRSWEVSDRKFKCGEPKWGGRAESRGWSTL